MASVIAVPARATLPRCCGRDQNIDSLSFPN
jgi:hypothetical protein